MNAMLALVRMPADHDRDSAIEVGQYCDVWDGRQKVNVMSLSTEPLTARIEIDELNEEGYAHLYELRVNVPALGSTTVCTMGRLGAPGGTVWASFQVVGVGPASACEEPVCGLE